MAYSKVPFTYTSGPQVFPTNFALGVLEADHIKVYVDGVVDGLGEPVEYAFTYNAANGDVTVTDALTSGQTGTINRIVPIDTLIADFEAGADVSKRNLVRAVKQTLMAVQEAADGREADSILINETVDDINAIAATIGDNVAQTTADRIAAQAAAAAAVPAAATATAAAATATTQAGAATTANTAAQAAKTAAEAAADRAKGYATRAAFITANTALPGLGLADGQVVVAGGYEYRRLSASTTISDLPGWVPNGWGFFEQWGVVGDGVVDDKTAFQAALDSGWAYLKGTHGAVYRLVTAVVCPSNRTIDLNGARLRRGGTSQWMFETEKARTTWDAANITLYNWWCVDDGTVATRGNFNLLVGDNIRVFGAAIVARAPYTGGDGAWSFYISGENCQVHDVTINSEAAGLYSDGIHVGYVKNFVIGAHHIRTGDDCIALYPAPRSYSWCGKNLKSQNVTVMPGFSSSTEANALRIGAQHYLDPVTNASPANTGWENVNILGETVGQCKTVLDITDRRTTSDITGGNKNTEISVKVNLIDQTANSIRLVNIAGNPDITSAANRTQHNIGRVKIELNGRQLFGTGGTPGQIFYGGGADRLELSGDLISDPSATVAFTHCSFFQIDDLVMTSVTGRTDTTAAFMLLTYVRRFYLENPDFTNDGNTEFQAISVALNTDQDTSVYVSGGRINDTARVFNITGTGAMRDFHLVGTQIAGTVVTNPNLSAVTSWTAGGTVICEPAGGYRTTVANLFGTGVPVTEGHRAFVTDANATTFASIVAAGGANKVPVYRDGTAWRIG